MGRLEKLMRTLYGLAAELRRDFQEATKEDIIQLIGEMEKRGYAGWTRYDYKTILKRFYKWLKETDDRYPEGKPRSLLR